VETLRLCPGRRARFLDAPRDSRNGRKGLCCAPRAPIFTDLLNVAHRRAAPAILTSCHTRYRRARQRQTTTHAKRDTRNR